MTATANAVRTARVTAAALPAVFGVAVPTIGRLARPAREALCRNHCVVCHGEKGDGKGIAAPSFGGKITDFTNPDHWKKTDDRKIVNGILKGQGRMPAQPVSPEQARAIAEYMKSEFRGRH
ncbi:MAG: cytochrome c [Syntrophaceae bacterium]|nr:cytochrome c [Syntrophaceae bacterium]